MKTLTLRLSETDYSILREVSAAERMPMTQYLLRLFDKHGKPQASRKTAPVSLNDTALDPDNIEWPDEA